MIGVNRDQWHLCAEATQAVAVLGATCAAETVETAAVLGSEAAVLGSEAAVLESEAAAAALRTPQLNSHIFAQPFSQ